MSPVLAEQIDVTRQHLALARKKRHELAARMPDLSGYLQENVRSELAREDILIRLLEERLLGLETSCPLELP